MAQASSKPSIPLWLARALMYEPDLVLRDAARIGIKLDKPLLAQEKDMLDELRRDCLEFCPQPRGEHPEIKWPHPFNP